MGSTARVEHSNLASHHQGSDRRLQEKAEVDVKTQYLRVLEAAQVQGPTWESMSAKQKADITKILLRETSLKNCKVIDVATKRRKLST